MTIVLAAVFASVAMIAAVVLQKIVESGVRKREAIGEDNAFGETLAILAGGWWGETDEQ